MNPLRLARFLALATACCFSALPGFADEAQRIVEDSARFKLNEKANPALPTLHLVGDSTMKVGTAGQRGWGDEMARYFDASKINVINQAIGGRSSRTYQTEGRWDAVLAKVAKGDWVIIQFGHNDSGALNEKPPITKSTRARGTIKGVGEESVEVDNILTGKHEVVRSFGWYLRKYAKDTKAKGATPYLLSLVPRNSFKDGVVNRSGANSYGGWTRLAAESEGVTFIDHNDIIARGLEAAGPEEAKKFFSDNLHATPAGAAFNARMAISGLKALPGNPFGPYFSEAANDVPAASPSGDAK